MSDLGLTPASQLTGQSPFLPAGMGVGMGATSTTATAPRARALTNPALPVPGASPFSLGQPSAPPVDKQYQAHLTTLTNKYAEMSEELAALPGPLREALISFDSRRVSRGSPPLTREQTSLAIQTALQNQPATPEPDRNPLNVLGNFRADLSDILKAIPRLPIALAKEVTDLPNFADRVQENRDAGMNEIAAILNAPGVRMVPGAYLAGNLAQGGEGVRELATHPLMSFLDVLPAASKVAAGTDVAKAAAEVSTAAGRRARPLAAVMTGRVLRDSNGNLVRGEVRIPHATEASRVMQPDLPIIERTRVGQTMDALRETSLGQALESFGGKTSRMVSRDRGALEQQYKSLFEGSGAPSTVIEEMAKRAGTMFDKYTDEYPFLARTRDAAGPEMDAARAQFYQTLQRDPSSLNPQLVGEYRQLTEDVARTMEADGKLGMFDDEWYDIPTAKKLWSRETSLTHAERMWEYANLYRNPVPVANPAAFIDNLRVLADDVAGTTNRRLQKELGAAFENVLDAHGLDYKALQKVRAAMFNRKATPADWRAVVDDVLNDAANTGTFTPRRTMDDIIRELRQFSRTDPQAARLIDAVRDGKRNRVTAILKNLGDRKPPRFPDELYPSFRDDVRSMSRRVEFDAKGASRYTAEYIDNQRALLDKAKTRNAPARFQALIADKVTTELPTRMRETAEQSLGRTLTPDEAGALTRTVLERRWGQVPGVDVDTAAALAKVVEKEAASTWRMLKANGANPAFVHKVTAGRANQALSGNINPLPVSPSQARERVLDLSPEIQDVQISLRHQVGELLQREYNELFADQVVERVGIRESALREQLAGAARDRMAVYPSLTFESALQKVIENGYEKFNVNEARQAWGSVKLSKYAQEDWYIPKSIASNLHAYAKPPSIISTVMDPITRAFRYSVIGLSPSVVVNNFFSNAVAMSAESGLRPWRHWNEARNWLRDPSLIPNEQLKAMMGAEIPDMQSVSREAWLSSRTGAKVMEGFNAGQAFRDSAIAEGAKRGKSALDSVVEKSLHLQRLGDNVYRAMQYMDEYEKLVKKGGDATPEAIKAAEAGAMEMVRRTFVDYTSFTPIERSAMRSIIPFYSYMGHAARFIMRYPFDHPTRTAITAHLADAERDRLGALPGSYLSMIPLDPRNWLDSAQDTVDAGGKTTMFALRPFDPFGDISDLFSIAGWMSSTNPIIQTALQQIGVVRGEAELYPTLRYDPSTGRMVAVHGSVLSQLFHNTVPRAGLLTSVMGLNPAYNEVNAADPAAARRMLVSAAGFPRAWRSVSPFQDMFRSEVSRQTSANDVENEALRSGNWNEALRYPSLRDMYARLLAASPEQLEQFTPADQSTLAEQLRILLGSGQAE